MQRRQCIKGIEFCGLQSDLVTQLQTGAQCALSLYPDRIEITDKPLLGVETSDNPTAAVNRQRRRTLIYPRRRTIRFLSNITRSITNTICTKRQFIHRSTINSIR